ncbi:MAG: Maf family protein [Woeseiaceae bacterium]
MTDSKIHLASSSARRREILTSLGVRFSWAATDADESVHPGETAESLVVRLAMAKARVAGAREGTVVLAADTVVVVHSDILGKPTDSDDAVNMLLRLSGREHRVLSGVAVLEGGRLLTAISSTLIRFRTVSPEEARSYCATGECDGKAGAYAIQGLGGVFVESLSGSYSGVVGLPVFETVELLRQAGVDIWKHTTIARAAE